MAQDFIENMHQIKRYDWLRHVQLNILVTPTNDFSLLHQEFDFPVSLTAFVFSDNDLNMLEELSEFQNVHAIPLYNKNNLIFFETNVFMDKYEMNNLELSKNDIFMQQAFNTMNFGKLTILPDGSVYANVNAPVLGNIKDSPYSIVYKEFTEGKSWFNIRDKAPCKDCLYQWLCPSPSNFEIAIGKPNLCHEY